MKKIPVWQIVAGCLFVVLTLWLLLTVGSCGLPPEEATESPSPGTVVETSSVSPTPTLTILQYSAKVADSVRVATDKSTPIFTGIGINLLMVVAIALGIALVVFLIWLVVGNVRKSVVVVEDFVTGDSSEEDASKTTGGLSQLFREKLIEELKDQERMLTYSPNEIRRLHEQPSVQHRDDTALKALSDSVSSVSPEPAKSILSLLTVLFPPNGTRVTGTLLSQGATPGRLGIVFELADLSGVALSEWFTVCEPQDTASKSSSTSSESGERSAEVPSAQRYVALLGPAAQVVALEVTRRAYESGKPKNGTRAEAYQAFGDWYVRTAPVHSEDGHAAMFYRYAITYYNKHEEEAKKEAEEDAKKALLPGLFSHQRRPVPISEDRPYSYEACDGLGDVYSYLGKPYTAIQNYGQALCLVRELKQKSDELTRYFLDYYEETRIEISKSMEELRSGNKALGAIAKTRFETDLKHWIKLLNGTIVPQDKDSMDAYLLYDAACWYSAFSSTHEADEESANEAIRNLLNVLVLQPEWWDWALLDPDLQNLRPTLTTLKQKLEAQLVLDETDNEQGTFDARKRATTEVLAGYREDQKRSKLGRVIENVADRIDAAEHDAKKAADVVAKEVGAIANEVRAQRPSHNGGKPS